MTQLKVNVILPQFLQETKNPKNQSYYKILSQGVQAVGDIGQIITSFAYEPADVGVLQGYVHPGSKTVPHLNLRRAVLEGQKALNRRTIIADANLFLAYDPKNTNTYPQDIVTMAYFLIPVNIVMIELILQDGKSYKEN